MQFLSEALEVLPNECMELKIYRSDESVSIREYTGDCMVIIVRPDDKPDDKPDDLPFLMV